MTETRSVEAATLVYRRDTFTVRPGMTVRHAIMLCGLNPEALLAVQNGKLITEDIILEPGDQIKLVATIFGG